MPEPLSLMCFEIEGDTLHIQPDYAKNCPVVSLTMRNHRDQEYAHTLDADDARTLFNWLGVWLHTEGAS